MWVSSKSEYIYNAIGAWSPALPWICSVILGKSHRSLCKYIQIGIFAPKALQSLEMKHYMKCKYYYLQLTAFK